MSVYISFPGLLLFLAAGLMELLWIAPTLEAGQPRESRLARNAGIVILIAGLALYAAGRIFG